MKNLKKVLSLVLALAMALSLMTAAFAADAGDFNDYDKVSHNEAVDVMTKIGVFNGTGNGNNFDPTGTLTREQAAKIIVYMLVGQEDGDKLTTLVAPFSDVSADRWSAGAIAYCANKGILAGTGGGKFNPTGELTGLAFSKMLLVALGYNAEKENLTGTSWAINAASLGVSAGLAENLTAVSLSGPITREQAAQMAFNAEKATMVQYGSTTTVTNGDSVVTISGDRRWVSNDLANNNHINQDTRMQFAEEYCRNLVRFGDSDAFNNPGDTWTFKGEDIGTYVDEADLTYTEEVKYKALKNDMPAGVLNNIGTLRYYIDGASAAFSLSDLRNGTDTGIGAAGSTGNGVLTRVFWDYDEDDKDYDVTITSVNTYAVKVVNSEQNKDGTYAIEVDVGSNYDFDATGSFNTDDIILLTWSAKTGNTESVAAAESVTGDTTRVRTNNAGTVGERFTMDGTEYKYNNAFNVLSAGEVGKLTANAKNVVAYLDEYGYVVRIDNADSSSDYAVVLGYASGWTSNSMSNRQVQLLLADGTVVTADAKNKFADGSTITWGTGSGNVGADTVVSYSVDKNGVYTFDKTVTQSTSANPSTKFVSLDNGVSRFYVGNTTASAKDGTPYYATDKTAFFLYDGTDHSAYIGVKNVPSLSGEMTSYAIKTRGSVAEAVYITSASNIETGTSGSRAAFLYVTGSEKHYDVKDGDRYYTVSAVVDGEATTVDVSRGYYGSLSAINGSNEEKLVTKMSIKDGIVTNVTAETDTTKYAFSTDQFAAAKDGVIEIGDVAYTYKSDAIAFVYDVSDDAFSRRSIGALRAFDKTPSTPADAGYADAVSVMAQIEDGVVVAVYYVQA